MTQRAFKEGRNQGFDEGLSVLIQNKSASIIFENLLNPPKHIEEQLGKGFSTIILLLRQVVERAGCTLYGEPGEKIEKIDVEDMRYQPIRTYDDMSTITGWVVKTSGIIGPSGKIILPAKVDEIALDTQRAG